VEVIYLNLNALYPTWMVYLHLDEARGVWMLPRSLN